MQDFLERWKTDERFKTKVKLLTYTLFVVIVSVYAISANASSASDDIDNISDIINQEENKQIDNVTNEDVIQIPEQYKYDTKVTINGVDYQYTGEKTNNETTIIKTIDDKTTEYIYKDNDYYVKESGIYIKSTKEEVYDKINSNYINLENINTYLSKAKKSNNQYLIYLKDMVLGNDSEDYFTITVRDNELNIDYTPLMNLFDQNIRQYNVRIIIDEIE